MARLDTSRIAETRKRGFRATYADGVVEIDFLTRQVTNTTPRPLARAGDGRSAGRIRGRFVAAVQGGAEPLVQPEQAAQALETALSDRGGGGSLDARCRPRRRHAPRGDGLTAPLCAFPSNVLNSGHDRTAFRIALAQLNPVMGDIAGNLARAREARARVADADVILFSELFITGYPPEDLVLKAGAAGRCPRRGGKPGGGHREAAPPS